MRLGEAARHEHATGFARELGAGWIEVERGIWEYDAALAVPDDPPLEPSSETLHRVDDLVPEVPAPSESPLLPRWLSGAVRRQAQTLGSRLDDRFGEAALRIAGETRDLSRRLARHRR